MANPVINSDILKRAGEAQSVTSRMTVQGTMTKSLLLLLMVVLAGAFTWKVTNEAIDPSSVTSWMIGGMIVGLITALIITFKPKSAPLLSPVYAAAEGLVLGAISALYNNSFAETAPNIVINAVLLTILCAFIMFILYDKQIVKVNGTFMRVLTIALTTVFVYYIGTMLLSLFGVNISLLEGTSLLSIGISCIITAVAAFSLISDFHSMRLFSENNAPKYFEWYFAFGFMVTLIWLYLEILRLLAKVNSRD